MSLTLKIFRTGLKQISKDGMLIALLPAPFIVGMVFKFGVPFLNGVAEERFSFSLVTRYGLVDGLLICLTPLFTAMVCAFTLLEERDEGVGAFYRITPAAGAPYLSARLGLPMLWAYLATNISAALYNISGLPLPLIPGLSAISALTGLAMSLMVVSLAGNRVEGLAISKLMGISLLGLFAVWFVPAPYYYIAAFLPSFWIGKILFEGAYSPAFQAGFAVCLAWIGVLGRGFARRVE